jgi:hypothetical protein
MTDAASTPAPVAAGPNTEAAQTAGKTEAAQAASKTKAAQQARKSYYDCGGGRKTCFSVVFVLLLPFFVSVPVMLFQRIMKGVWLDTWGLIVIAVIFSALMLLLLFELMFSLRAYVEIGPEKVSFTLPDRGGGVIPLFFYHSRTIPYAEIKAVETRREVYGNVIAPMMMRTVMLVLHTGERILLGHANEADDDPRFPYIQIGRQIAERAEVPFIDKGNVLRRLHRKMFGLAQSETISEESEIANLNRKHGQFLLALVGAMIVFLVIGIGADILSESRDSGEQGRTVKIERGAATGR